MAIYVFRCGSCAEEREADFPIGEAPRLLGCEECGGRAQLVIGAGVQIAPSALESKGGEVRKILTREQGWDRDMPAYKRMRGRGLQPENIDGAAKIENEVQDNFDVTWKKKLKKLAPTEPYAVTKQRVQEGLQEAKDFGAIK